MFYYWLTISNCLARYISDGVDPILGDTIANTLKLVTQIAYNIMLIPGGVWAVLKISLEKAKCSICLTTDIIYMWLPWQLMIQDRCVAL